jgi:hypothetical protein
MKPMSGLGWKTAAATVLTACAISTAFAGHGGGVPMSNGGDFGGYGDSFGMGYEPYDLGANGIGMGYGGIGFGGPGTHGYGFRMDPGLNHGGSGSGGAGLGVFHLRPYNLGHYSGYDHGGYGSPYYVSNEYAPAPTPTTTAAPYPTNQTYEPGDGYSYPLYYNPATGGYVYYPVAH